MESEDLLVELSDFSVLYDQTENENVLNQLEQIRDFVEELSSAYNIQESP